MSVIFIDGDACPVKQEVYRVAHRYGVHVRVVADSWMRVPEDDGIELIVVKGDFDAADDWIVEHAGEGDIVVTGDIPLADRCLKLGARVLGLRGREFTEESIVRYTSYLIPSGSGTRILHCAEAPTTIAGDPAPELSGSQYRDGYTELIEGAFGALTQLANDIAHAHASTGSG